MPDYDESLNFNHRLKVETTYAPGEVRDHRDGFIQEQYKRNMQDKPQPDKGPGFPDMNSVTQPPKPKGGIKHRKSTKTKEDQSLIDANAKDLKSRNLK